MFPFGLQGKNSIRSHVPFGEFLEGNRCVIFQFYANLFFDFQVVVLLFPEVIEETMVSVVDLVRHFFESVPGFFLNFFGNRSDLFPLRMERLQLSKGIPDVIVFE